MLHKRSGVGMGGVVLRFEAFGTHASTYHGLYRMNVGSNFSLKQEES